MKKDVISEKFDEWTENLGPKESRIEIFKRIRDIPFGLIPGLIDPEESPIGILTHNRGSCSPKHFLLGLMYQRLKIQIKYATYPFYWNDLNVEYPVMLKQLADEMPLEYHVACKAYINEKWILIDATWDQPLEKVGFPVNESWYGIGDTLNAVKPLDEIIHENVQDRIEYVRGETARHTDKENSLSNRFYGEFIKWLEEIRTGG